MPNKSTKQERERNKVYVECSETYRRVKGRILHKDEHRMEVEMPTGAVLDLRKRTRRGHYRMSIGILEFLSDGREIS